jgi:hypothetical protein
MTTQPYYNTNGPTRQEVQTANVKADGQAKAVLAWYERNKDYPWPASRCYRALLHHYHIHEDTPITSKGLLIKLPTTYPGPQGTPEHLFQFNANYTPPVQP